MKKRLLFAALAMFCTVGTFAANVGDYVYSHTAKYKVTGGNLVTNGNFTVGDGSEGWKNGAGQALSETWKVVTNVGLEDANAIESQGASTEEADMLTNSWKLQPGLYVVSYNVYATENTTSSITAGNANCVVFFANATGDNTVERTISDAESWMGEQWTQVVDTIFVNTDEEYLVFNASNVTEGFKFSQFEIHQVSEVYDSRTIDRLIEYAEKLLQEPDLSTGRDEFEGIVGMLKEAIANPSEIEDVKTAEALIMSFNEAFDDFLNQNGGNTNSGDWTTVAGRNWNSLNDYNFVGNYWTVGGRWGFFPNAPFVRNDKGDMADLERTEGEGYILTAGIQRNYDLGAIGVKVENTNLKPGKYFFSIEAQAVAAANSSAPYGNNYNLPFIGPSITIGSDTKTFENDTLSGYYWKRYYYIAEVKEGETVMANFIFPAYSDKRGGKASLRNPEFRLLGKTEVQIAYEENVKEVYVQQTELKKRIDTYPDDVAGYWWAKYIVTEAIDVAQPVYEESLQLVTSETDCTLDVSSESVETLKDLAARLLDQVRAMNTAKNNVIAANAVFANLEDQIKEAKDVLADDLYQDGDKATLQNVISAAEAKLAEIKASTSDETRDGDEEILNNTIEKLVQATDAFKASANLTPIIDIDFSNSYKEADGNYWVEGAAGQIDFATDAFDTDNNSGAIKYMLGYYKTSSDYTGPVLEDVLRLGPGIATVELPEIQDNEALLVSFDIWFGKLVGKFQSVELRNANDERVAGFNYNCYDNKSEFNDFNNEENTGLNLLSYATGIGASNQSNDAICADNNKSSFKLLVDYKNNIVKGDLSNPQKGNCKGAALPIPSGLEDTKVTKLVLYSNYNNADRRSWFDNLLAYKYTVLSGISVTGDVNGDGAVNVADISAIIDVMAAGEFATAADVNGDGAVNVADISAVIDIMAGN